MRRALLLFSAGIAGAVFVADISSVLPAASFALGLLAVMFPAFQRCFPSSYLSRLIFTVACMLIGFLWHLAWADRLLQQRLPADLEGTTLLLEGVVANLPEVSNIAQQFEFIILSSESDFSGSKVLLNYYGEKHITPGQHWRFSVRLNRPHGFSNPGGFDYEGWLFQKGISAKGYVRNSMSNQLLAELIPQCWLHPLITANRWRYSLKFRIGQSLADSPYQSLVLALTLGDKSAISQENWQLFSATGSNHLFVVSGLHIGLISAFSYWLVFLLLRLAPAVPLRLAYPAQKVAALFGLLAAVAYALLAGFSLPTQRALIMIVVFILGGLSNRRVLVSFRFLLALAGVLLLNPLAFINAGFWFSFSAVAALLLVTSFESVEQYRPESNYSPTEKSARTFNYLAKPQLVVFLALSLPLIFWTQQLSLASPLINMIAIPVVGFLVVPLCFLGLLCNFVSGSFSDILFSLAEHILRLLLESMQYLLDVGAASFVIGFPSVAVWQLIPLSFAVLLLLLPRAVPGRCLLIPLCLPIILPMLTSWLPLSGKALRARTSDAVLAVHVVDVGQGLAVVVATDRHALVYDTGANLSADFNMGAAVLFPVLRSLGIQKLDMVVVSHGDNDHAGGLSGLQSNIEIKQLVSNNLNLNSSLPISLCTQLEAWKWDLVEFQFLQTGLEYASENNNSCVLQLAFGAIRILLPGDIETEAENNLVRRYGEKLQSTVMLAPHHGSASSSSYALLKHAKPKYIVFSAGYKNSFNHPNEKVLARYGEFGSKALDTASSGMVSFEFNAGNKMLANSAGPRLYREENFRYWH